MMMTTTSLGEGGVEMSSDVIVVGETAIRVVWLLIGLVLGYTLGVAQTALHYARRMHKELHECHEMLAYAKEHKGDADKE